MKKFLSTVAIVCVSFLLLAEPDCIAMENSGQSIEINAAAEKIKKNPKAFYILDVRTPAEFREGHVPGAHNIDFWGATFEYDIEKLPKDKPVLLYCRTGKRSAGAEEVLKKSGFKNIVHMPAGFDAWKKAGLPIENSK